MQKDQKKAQEDKFKEEYTTEEIKKIQAEISRFNEKDKASKETTTVLYVDDEPLALTTFKAAFRRVYDVHTANSAEEGRAILKEQDIKVIITDQRMPKETGIEFLISIIEKYPQPLRIILTGYADINAVVDAVNKGQVFRYLSKPYRTEEMLLTINNAAEVFDLCQAGEELTKVSLRTNQQLEFLLRQKLLS